MPLVDDGYAVVYPDLLNRPARQGYTQQVSPLEPIPNPAPPTDWTVPPVYPDRTRRQAGLGSRQRAFTYASFLPVANTEWKASYPDRLRRPRLPVASMPAWFGPNFYFLAIAGRQAWIPKYPSILRRARTVPPSQSVYPIQPSTIIATATCVEWAEVDLIRPEIVEEAVVRPSMTCDTHEIGYLLLEDGGFLLLEDGGKIELEDQTGCTQEAFVRPMMAEEDVC